MSVPRPALLLTFCALLVGACATPREHCIRTATQEQRVIDNLIAETEASIARGYAIETRIGVRRTLDFCHVADSPYGAPARMCMRNEPVERAVPVAIDRAEQQRKLETLRTRQAELKDRTAQALQRCDALYPAR